jgi:hypothetical protein
MSTPKINIWTIQLGQRRIAEKRGIKILDITAKSGIRAFAPLFSDVMAYKNGIMSEESYTEVYKYRMEESRKRFPNTWRQLWSEENVAVACYCRAGVFCHRHLFVPMMKKFLEENQCEVILHDEILKSTGESK